MQLKLSDYRVTFPIFFVVVVAGTYAALVIAERPIPNALDDPRNLSQNDAVFAGAIVGAVTTALFFLLIQYQQDTIKKEQEDIEDEQSSFARAVMISLYPTYIAAYRVGQQFGLLLTTTERERDRDGGVRLKAIEELCKAWKWEGAYIKAAEYLNSENLVENYNEIRKIFYHEITNMNGNRAADMYLAGLYIIFFAAGRGEIRPQQDFIEIILTALDGFFVKRQIFEYCEKSFDMWSEQKIDSESATLFLELIDLHITSGGSRAREAKQLEEFLSSSILPSHNDFKEQAGTIVKTYPSRLQRYA